MRFAFVNLQSEGKRHVRARLDQIAAVEACDCLAINGVKVTLMSGSVLHGARDVREVWDAMVDAADWLDDEDGA